MGINIDRIAIIGLGLMGGSMAYALDGFMGARVTGMDIDQGVCELATSNGAVSEAGTDFHKAVSDADLVIFCVYAHVIPGLISRYSGSFKEGAILADICGVKTPLYAEIEPILPDGVDYVGVHPMAGKEVDGFSNADASIFKNTGFIITPLLSTKLESVDLMTELAGYIGATRVAINSPEQHDAIIAYTSDLMHISAAALCMDFGPGMTLAHTAGAFRDCTRVANIKADAWTELLLSNGENTLAALERYIENLNAVREALYAKDAPMLRNLLDRAAINKKEMQGR